MSILLRQTAQMRCAAALLAVSILAILASPASASERRSLETVRMTATFNSPFGKVPRDKLSEAQRRQLRAYGREMCRERLKSVGPGWIRSISILKDGRVRCFYAA